MRLSVRDQALSLVALECRQDALCQLNNLGSFRAGHATRLQHVFCDLAWRHRRLGLPQERAVTLSRA